MADQLGVLTAFAVVWVWFITPTPEGSQPLVPGGSMPSGLFGNLQARGAHAFMQVKTYLNKKISILKIPTVPLII